MGASLVALAYARWWWLPDRAFRVLVYMSLTALDDDKPPRYFGGRDALAGAIGRRVPAEPARADASDAAHEARRQRRAAYEAVRAGLLQLTAAGVIERGAPARPGRNAEYALRLWTNTTTDQGEPGPLVGAMAQGQPAQWARVSLSNGTGSACAMGQGQPGPKEQAGTTGTAKDYQHPNVSHNRDVDNDDVDNDDSRPAA